MLSFFLGKSTLAPYAFIVIVYFTMDIIVLG